MTIGHLWGQGQWWQWYKGELVGVSSPGGHHFVTRTQPHPTGCRLQCWDTSDQTTNRAGTQPQPPADKLPKVFLNPQPPLNTPWDTALFTRGTRHSSTHQWAGTSPSHQEACTSLQNILTHWGQTPEAKGTTTLQPREWKLQSQKVRQNEMAKEYVSDEGTRQNPRKTTK